MVRSDQACSGVMFTLDTESGFRDVVVINAAWGLGEAIVQGMTTPDEWVVFKQTLRQGARSIISRRLGTKEVKMVYGLDDRGTRIRDVVEAQRSRFVLERLRSPRPSRSSDQAAFERKNAAGFDHGPDDLWGAGTDYLPFGDNYARARGCHCHRHTTGRWFRPQATMFLKRGDRVDVEIEKLGVLVNTVACA